MMLGIIIGYFYGKGLILCPNNKLRYFDILDGLKEEFDSKFFCGLDKKGNVNVCGCIEDDCIASYSIDKKDKYKAVLEKRFSSDDTIQGEFSEELSYFIKHKKEAATYDAGQILKEITDYVLGLDIDSILSTYRIEEVKEVEPNRGQSGATTSGVRYSIQTEDAYIKSILPLRTATHISYNPGRREDLKIEDSYKKRLSDKETQNLIVFKTQYSTINHINYLVNKRINKDIKSLFENEKRRNDILSVLSTNYPVETIGYIINRRWPHMSPRMLCVKYNNEFDGTNFDIFGHKDSSKKQYYEKKRRIAYKAWLKRREDNYDTWDPEQEVMTALMNGCGEYFGY